MRISFIRFFSWASLSILLMGVSLFAVNLIASRGEAIDLTKQKYGFGERVTPGWRKVCLIGQHELPSTIVKDHGEAPCDLGFDVAPKTMLMVYFYAQKQCEYLKFKGHFLGKYESETRCFNPEDLNYFKISYENGLISLKEK